MSDESHAALINEMATQWDAQGRSSSSQMQAASWLLRANLLLIARYEEILGSLGLTMARWECLAVLYWSKNRALGLTKMSVRLAVHPTTITYAVDQLERAGLVERVAHPHDRRQILAALTEEGVELTEKGLDLLERERFGLANLPERDLNTLSRLLSEFLARLVPSSESAPVEPGEVSGDSPDGTMTRGRPRRGGGVRNRRAGAGPGDDEPAR